MRNIFINTAITMTGVLSIGILYLLFQYINTEENIKYENISYLMIDSSIDKQSSKKTYLSAIEGYNDIDVNTKGTKDITLNEVAVKSETPQDSISKTLDETHISENKEIDDNIGMAIAEVLRT